MMFRCILGKKILHLTHEITLQIKCKRDQWTYTWDIIVVATTVRKKSITNFPGKYGRAFSLIIGDSAKNKVRNIIHVILSSVAL